jgi:hypothetical protein
MLASFQPGTKTAFGITDVLTKKVLAVYPPNARKAAIEYQDRLDSRCGKSIHAAWEYTKEELEAKGFSIPLGWYDQEKESL